eukprot:CAMPEP_0113504950 /NCGR_PEP_ID=MMETSP0014_2-20120614/35018_1 /TAXON_ID=2857 /ORGANISM="Nitzschia sp." /LENGTH=219 /DNA_ID=CAMNT_0000400153 /DNA_START=350 /DNA_END=1009 /DNA_ORIENTATION=+ /assembly_acc=CAM_ASM_000159
MIDGASNINAMEASSFQFHHYSSGGGCTGGTVRPLLSHHFRTLGRRPRNRPTNHTRQDGSNMDEEDEDLDNGRHQVSFRYTTSIITTTNGNGQRYHRRVEDQGNNIDYNVDDDDDDDDTETWTPIVPFVVVLPRRVEHKIVRVLRQLPDVMFLFWCLYVVCFLLLVHNHHHHHCQGQAGQVDYCDNYHDSIHSPQATLHEFQLRRELGLITPPPTTTNY